jgi:hypothetical protein
MDSFTVPTLTFRLLYVLLIIRHARRQVRHVNVTATPTATWVSQQLREAFPFAGAPRYVLLDRDAIFSAAVCGTLRRMGVRPVRTSFQSSWQNGVAERWVAAPWMLWDFVVATVSRYLHAAGMLLSPSLDCPQPLRFAGALGTYVCGLALVAAALGV